MSPTTPPEEFESLVDYIVKTYRHMSKIVEVGIGRFCGVAIELKKRLPQVEIIVTDISEEAIEEVKRLYPTLKAVRDDVTNPNLDLYKNADLVYSIRAPPELWPALADLAQKVGSALIIRPLPPESPIPMANFRLVNFGEARFYVRSRLEKAPIY